MKSTKATDSKGFYIALISVHGLIRGQKLELGRDADTGGQTKYVVDFAKALANQDEVDQVDLITLRVTSDAVSDDYAETVEKLSDKARIVRIDAGIEGYVPKETLWDFLDIFTDNTLNWFKQQDSLPQLLHSHYADAGYVAARISNRTGVPFVHTGHSLGRDKRRRLMATGLAVSEIDQLYNMGRRIDAEEQALASAALVITSTRNEINDQYEIYDYYHPERMTVIPPGIDLDSFHPPLLGEPTPDVIRYIRHVLHAPEKPIILALSRPDARKNISTLVKAYGESPKLQDLANLVIIAGNRDDIRGMEDGAKSVMTDLLILIDYYDLYGKVAMPKHHESDEVPQIYRHVAMSSGVFVNPALTEPFGLTLLEAAACGIPLVATENGGPVDIIGNCHNGVLVDPLDISSIQKALLKLLNKTESWQKASRNGLKNIPRFYSWSSHAERYLTKVTPIIESRKLLPEIPTRERPMGKHHRAIFTDIDQNLLGDRRSLKELTGVIKANRQSTTFGINTTRRLDSAMAVLKEYKIPIPDVFITSLGTEIYYAPELTPSTNWEVHIDHLWHASKLSRLLKEFPQVEKRSEKHQSKFKLSYKLLDDVDGKALLEEVVSRLRQEDQTVNVVYSRGKYLDITPIRASKGLALRYIANLWDIPLDKILVAGGSGADEDMMRGNTLAVVVGNRKEEELSELSEDENIFFAESQFAAGILEAIKHYQFFNTASDS